MVTDSSPLRLLLVGAASEDLERLRRRMAANPLFQLAGVVLLDAHGRVPIAGAAVHDAVLLTPEAARQADSVNGRAAKRPDAAIAELNAETLTAREQEVLSHAADGLGNRAIGERLGISEHTVKFHLASIYGKLAASNRTEAVQAALRRGLLEI